MYEGRLLAQASRTADAVGASPSPQTIAATRPRRLPCVTSDHYAAATREASVNSILNFGRLDAVARDLQLVVYTPHEMEQPVGVPLDGVARAIPRDTIRVGCKGVTAVSRVKVA